MLNHEDVFFCYHTKEGRKGVRRDAIKERKMPPHTERHFTISERKLVRMQSANTHPKT